MGRERRGEGKQTQTEIIGRQGVQREIKKALQQTVNAQEGERERLRL